MRQRHGVKFPQDIGETIRELFQQLIVPELDGIRRQIAQLQVAVKLTNKRLDDMNAHLVDQSRRIDETNTRMDDLRQELTAQMAETNKRVDDLREELTARIDGANARIDTLTVAVVRREDQERLERRQADLEKDVQSLKQKVA
ncbi:MAG: hypothetical protein ACP5NF_06650 [Thermoanaerobaculum sp.]